MRCSVVQCSVMNGMWLLRWRLGVRYIPQQTKSKLSCDWRKIACQIQETDSTMALLNHVSMHGMQVRSKHRARRRWREVKSSMQMHIDCTSITWITVYSTLNVHLSHVLDIDCTVHLSHVMSLDIDCTGAHDRHCWRIYCFLTWMRMRSWGDMGESGRTENG